jgi:hypothetical protein
MDSIKNISMKTLIITIGLCAILSSCTKSEGFLENKSTALTEDQVFSDSLRTIQFLNGIYSEGTYGQTSYTGIGW